MAQRGYIMHKGEPEYDMYYDLFLCSTIREHARIFLPHEVEGKDTNPGKLVPVMWEWRAGARVEVEEE